MATITTIAAGDQITDSRAVINTNFANLNSDKIETSAIDTDTALAADSDAKIPSQKAVKAYVDAGGQANASTTVKGIVEEATEAEVLAGTAVGGTSARLFVNPSTQYRSKFSTTEVFNDAAPTSFTDLDLSATVGTTQRLVMLAVTCGEAGGRYFGFRRNGSTLDNTPAAGVMGGAANIYLSGTGITAYVIVPTDTSGVIEWRASAATSNVVIKLEAYW